MTAAVEQTSVSNQDVIRRLAMAFNTSNYPAVDDLVADDFVLHPNMMVPNGVRGPEGFKQLCVDILAAMPDAYHPVDHLIGEGDLVAIHLIFTGTFKNAYNGLQPTNDRVTFGMLNFWRVENGKAVEAWWYMDTLEVQQQLGLMPANKPPRRPLSEEEQANVALVGRILNDYFNEGRLDVIPELFHPNFTIYAADGSIIHGHEGAEFYVKAERAAFPDLYWIQEDLVVDGDKAILYFTGYGTFTGEWMGIPPNNKPIKWVGNALFRIENGKVVEDRLIWESLRFLQQLGAIPTPEVKHDPEKNKEVVHTIHLSWNEENRGKSIDHLLAPNWTLHPGAAPNLIMLYGIDQFKNWAGGFLKVMPDFKATIHATVAEGDLVAIRWTVTGTHQGEYNGAQPTGKPIEATGASLWRVNEAGQNDAIWFVMDNIKFMQDIGLK
jgi:predicted ester cyclase